MSARFLARNLAAVLREVADEGHTFAIQHFGRVVGFLVPREGREPVRDGGKTSWDVPAPLLQAATVGEIGRPLMDLELARPPLVRKTSVGYELTDEGRRHYEALSR